MLGGIGLTSDGGNDVDAILRQPKRVALLAYLAMPAPGVWHRRDELLGIFWPDLDQLRARTALRSALYGLRRQLPDGAIQTRGDDEVTVDSSLITTDVDQFSRAIAAGRYADALKVYAGDLLPALHIADAAGFEKWIEVERARLKSAARKAATELSAQLENEGNLEGALGAAKRASELDPEDESAARRWIAMLDRTGDRSQAFAVYQKFRNHIFEELGVRPSAETVALVDAIRTRHTANTPVAMVEPGVSERIEAAAPETVSPQLVERPPAHEISELVPVTSRMAKPTTRRLPLAVFAIALIAVVGALALQHRNSTAKSVGRRLVVLPMENETGDPKLDYVASGIAEGVAERLKGLGGLSISSGARSDWPDETRHDYRAIGREFGSKILLRTTLAKVGDSLEVRASVVDAATLGERSAGARRFAAADMRDAESSVAAAVAGALFRVAQPAVPRPVTDSVDPESYRLMVEGWHELLTRRNNARATELFEEATKLDARNARAWSGLSSAWANKTTGGTVPFDVGYDRSSAAAARALALDSLQGSAWANLAFLRGMRYGSLEVATELMTKAIAAEPGNPEIFMVKAAIYRQAHEWEKAIDASRVARAMDPLNPKYTEREAFVYLCFDRPETALKIYESYLSHSPGDELMQAGRVRTLARLGRYTEAISALAAQARSQGDSTMAKVLATATGREGYWAARHVQGKTALKNLLAKQHGEQLSYQRLLTATFSAGDLEKGFRMLQQPSTEREFYHIPCAPALDEVRDDPRFKSAVKRFGAMPRR